LLFRARHVMRGSGAEVDPAPAGCSPTPPIPTLSCALIADSDLFGLTPDVPRRHLFQGGRLEAGIRSGRHEHEPQCSCPIHAAAPVASAVPDKNETPAMSAAPSVDTADSPVTPGHSLRCASLLTRSTCLEPTVRSLDERVCEDGLEVTNSPVGPAAEERRRRTSRGGRAGEERRRRTLPGGPAGEEQRRRTPRGGSGQDIPDSLLRPCGEGRRACGSTSEADVDRVAVLAYRLVKNADAAHSLSRVPAPRANAAARGASA
jgi:hypothetical protein